MNINDFIRENSHMQYAQIAELVNKKFHKKLTGEAVRKRCRRMELPRKAEISVDLTSEEKVEQDIIVQNLRGKTRETDKKYKTLLEKINNVEAERDAVIEMKSNFETYKITPNHSSSSEATAFMVASDWHVEERVDPETVNGVNKYNMSIARKRGEKFFQNGLRLVKIMQKDITINTLVLPLLGDFFSGSIHDELLETGEVETIHAAIFAQNMLASGIEFLLKDKSLKEIIVPCHSGNHGRITLKSRHATESGNSLEYFMYTQLSNHFKNEKRVKFLVSKGYLSYLDVYGFKVRFQHGHSMRYGGGVGGITIPVKKAIAQWDKNQQADLTVFGHFHQLFYGGDFICNGSLIGYNAYALSIKASAEPPRQAFFLIDKKRGVSITAPIWVE